MTMTNPGDMGQYYGQPAYQPPAEPVSATPHRAPNGRARPILTGLIVVAALAIGFAVGHFTANGGTHTALPTRSSSPSQVAATSFTITGSMTLTDSDINNPSISSDAAGNCHGTGGYSDLQDGAQVIVTDPAGKTVALGTLGEGVEATVTSCLFPVNVPAVPTGLQFYGVAVTHRGSVQYSPEQLKTGVSLTLGS